MSRLLLIFLFFVGLPTIHGQTYLGFEDRDIYDLDVKGRMLGAVSRQHVELWDLGSMSLIKSVDMNLGAIPSAISFGLDSAELIVGGRNGEVIKLNLLSGERVQLIAAGGNGSVTSIAVNPKGNLVAVGFMRHSLIIYDLENLKEYFSFNFSSDVTSLKFSKDGNLLIASSASGEMAKISLESKKVEKIIKNSKWITSISVSSDRKKVGFASKNKVTTIENVETNSITMPTSNTIRLGGIIMNLDYHPTVPDCFSVSMINGELVIYLRGGNIYHLNTKAIVSQVKFIEQNDRSALLLAVATRGKGIQIIRASDMDYGQIRKFYGWK